MTTLTPTFDSPTTSWPKTMLVNLRLCGRRQYALVQCLRGLSYFHQGVYSQAIRFFNQTLALIETTAPVPLLEAITLGYMGQAYAVQSQYWFALACYDAALDVCHSQDSPALRYCQMNLLGWLADLCLCCGYRELANTYAAEALQLKKTISTGGILDKPAPYSVFPAGESLPKTLPGFDCLDAPAFRGQSKSGMVLAGDV